MKLLSVFFGIVAIFCVSDVAGLMRIAAADVPVSALWSFEDGNGNSAVDSSGNGNRAVLVGDATWSKSPIVGGTDSLQFHGAGWADVAGTVIDTSKSFTVAAWVQVSKVDGYQTFVSVDGSMVSGFYLQLRTGGKFAFTTLAKDDVTASATIASSLTESVPGTWYYLTGVHNTLSKVNQLYVNGRLQDTESFADSWAAKGHLVIGRGKYLGKATDYVSGFVRNVLVSQGIRIDPEQLQVLQKEFPLVPDHLSVDMRHLGSPISSNLYGLMIEDISHSIDGGLYAELIDNRSLSDRGDLKEWSVMPSDGVASISIDTTHPVSNTALVNSLRIAISTPGDNVGIANSGYWGFAVQPGTRYSGSFYARSTGTIGELTAELRTKDGTVITSATISRITEDWVKYSYNLVIPQTAAASSCAQFVVLVKGSGALWLTEVSLFPPTYNGRPNGARVDLMDKLAELHPRFLRLPGGNFLEGTNITDRFDWKRTIGPIEDRPGHNDPWGYWSSDGFGLQEYLNWCDDLHMEPVLAVYAGFSLSHQHVVAGPDLQPFVQDALDEIQYVTGDQSTLWGAKRAADGHPRPYHLQYVEIGNEDFFDNSGSYEGRFATFYDAIRSRYPNLKIIATRSDVKSRAPDLVDEHFYESARDLEGDWRHYDKYDRSGPKVFVGEYASQEGTPTPNLRGALGDASFMAGFERNADVVQIASYAPLLADVNAGASQWPTNLIGFDASRSYVFPAYYTQQLFSLYHGDRVVPAVLSGGSALPYSVNYSSERGLLYIKIVNPTGSPVSITTDLIGVNKVTSNGVQVVLSSDRDTDTNTIDQPNDVKPVKTTIAGFSNTFTHTFQPYSLTVLVLNVR